MMSSVLTIVEIMLIRDGKIVIVSDPVTVKHQAHGYNHATLVDSI